MGFATKLPGVPSASPEEMSELRAFAAARFEAEKPLDPPFSFTYGGRASGELVKGWRIERTTRPLDERRTERVLTCVDPDTALEVRCVAVEYRDFPVVEWTVYLKNGGAADTPLLSDIRSLDIVLRREEKDEFVLNYHTGDQCTADSYEPHRTPLAPKTSRTFAPAGGRPCTGAFPYFNLERAGGGMILAVGWPGQWAAQFARDEAAGLRVTAGQELTHFKLLPGEEVRTPLSALLFWKGDRVRSQNLWRRWMLAHNLPRPGGRLPAPLLGACSGGFFEGLKCNEADEIRFIDRYLAEGVPLDHWWMDAGWYPCGQEGWPKVGTWEPDPERFPRGIRAVSDHTHAKGLKMILWFEPERVAPGTWLHENRPQWLLSAQNARVKLFNLGNDEAREWLTNHVDKLLTEQGIDLYRQDFNMSPLPYWRANDADDRQGITEIRHVVGYLAYWDELRRRRPDMLIDSCASGGRRNDLETLRRAVPLLRSDYQSFGGDPAWALGNQCHSYALSSWMPYYGTGVYYNPQHTVYNIRSHMCPAFGIAADVRKSGNDWPLIRRMAENWRAVADCYRGDFYPLTSYHLEDDVWLAWQFNSPETGKGVLHVFRRMQSPYETARFALRGLDPEARYTVRNIDDEGAEGLEMTGHRLMEEGLPVELKNHPDSAVIVYQRAAKAPKRKGRRS